CGQTCLSCTGVENRSDCQHVTTCSNDEVCFVQKHTTESGSVLYDLGCAYQQFCRHSVGGIFGRRSEGHHVSCTSCCNDTTTCNIGLKCENDHHGTGSTLPRECSDIQGQHPDGVYQIYPDGISAVSVFCDMHTENGKWTVIQRRLNGSVNFEQNWKTYKEGFGYPNGEYWLGNDIIHEITVHNRHELRIDMGDFDGLTKYAKYTLFSVGDETGEYELTVLGYTGNAGDSMAYHDGMLFSTFDRDNDKEVVNCAKVFHGGSTLPRECSDIQGQHPDGVYTIYPDGISPVSVFCDMHTENGKWTVIQIRLNGSVNFEQNWKTYKEGFGYPNGEYWLGNNVIHEITVHNRHELRIDMGDFDGLTKYAKYSVFSVGDEKSEYELTVLGYSGNAGDSFSYHDRKLFSTIDHNKDNSTCTHSYHGGWWYGSCHSANLNGRYLSGTSPYGQGINWQAWHGYLYSLKSVKMMIRTLH
ncbi:Hypothetical predicted protein, partial [Mytilus galloprovincialis]